MQTLRLLAASTALLVLALLGAPLLAQNGALPPPVELTREQDRDRLMALLEI